MLDLCLMCLKSNDSLPIKLETLTLSLTNRAIQSPFFPQPPLHWNECCLFVCHCRSIQLAVAFVEFRDKALVPDHRPELIPVLAWFFRLLWSVLGDEEMALLLKPRSFVHWDDPDADIHPWISQKILMMRVPGCCFIVFFHSLFSSLLLCQPWRGEVILPELYSECPSLKPEG